MGNVIKGDVVILPFPFSDLSGSKRRPAFVVADLAGDDCILCQITSKANDALAVPLANADFIAGSLPVDSHIRPQKLFTADKNLIVSTAGRVSKTTTAGVINAIVSVLTTSV
jgi:mRNA interferase MazF